MWAHTYKTSERKELRIFSFMVALFLLLGSVFADSTSIISDLNVKDRDKGENVIYGRSVDYKIENGIKISRMPFYTEIISGEEAVHYYHMQLLTPKDFRLRPESIKVVSGVNSTQILLNNSKHIQDIEFYPISQISYGVVYLDELCEEFRLPEQCVGGRISTARYSYMVLDKKSITRQNTDYLVKVKTAPFQTFSWGIYDDNLSFDPEVSSCGTIASPGMYTLSNNITANTNPCIYITSPNVTLDCKGYYIIGNNTVPSAAISISASNVSVTNCNIVNVSVGISTYFTTNISVNNTTVSINIPQGSSDSGTGVSVYSCQRVNLTNLNINASYGTGLYFYAGGYHSVANVIINTPSNRSIELISTSNNNFNNITINSSHTGIYIGGSNNNHSFTNIQIFAEHSGICGPGSLSASFIDCMNKSIVGTAAGYSPGTGLCTGSSTQNNIIQNCNISNFATGVLVGSSNSVVSNIVSSAWDTAVHLSGSNISATNIYAISSTGKATYLYIKNGSINSIRAISTLNESLYVFLADNLVIRNATAITNSIFGALHLYMSTNVTVANSSLIGIKNDVYLTLFNATNCKNTIINTTGTGGKAVVFLSGVGERVANVESSILYVCGANNASVSNLSSMQRVQIYYTNNSSFNNITAQSGVDMSQSNSNYIFGLYATDSSIAVKMEMSSNNVICNSVMISNGSEVFSFGYNNYQNVICSTRFESGSKTGDLVRIYNSVNNTFYWNMFTDTSGRYVVMGSGNSFNTTINGKPEGNIYFNVLNGSVQIDGTAPSAYGLGWYIGSFGTGYPYNSTTSQNKMYGGGTDWGPLIWKGTLFVYPRITPLAPTAISNLSFFCSVNSTNGTQQFSLNYTVRKNSVLVSTGIYSNLYTNATINVYNVTSPLTKGDVWTINCSTTFPSAVSSSSSTTVLNSVPHTPNISASEQEGVYIYANCTVSDYDGGNDIASVSIETDVNTNITQIQNYTNGTKFHALFRILLLSGGTSATMRCVFVDKSNSAVHSDSLTIPINFSLKKDIYQNGPASLNSEIDWVLIFQIRNVSTNQCTHTFDVPPSVYISNVTDRNNNSVNYTFNGQQISFPCNYSFSPYSVFYVQYYVAAENVSISNTTFGSLGHRYDISKNTTQIVSVKAVHLASILSYNHKSYICNDTPEYCDINNASRWSEIPVGVQFVPQGFLLTTTSNISDMSSIIIVYDIMHVSSGGTPPAAGGGGTTVYNITSASALIFEGVFPEAKNIPATIKEVFTTSRDLLKEQPLGIPLYYIIIALLLLLSLPNIVSGQENILSALMVFFAALLVIIFIVLGV